MIIMTDVSVNRWVEADRGTRRLLALSNLSVEKSLTKLTKVKRVTEVKVLYILAVFPLFKKRTYL